MSASMHFLMHSRLMQSRMSTNRKDTKKKAKDVNHQFLPLNHTLTNYADVMLARNNSYEILKAQELQKQAMSMFNLRPTIQK